jgi:hypothetical protein
MVLCQFFIDGGVGLTLPARAYYPCNLNGRYKAKVQTIVFADAVAAGSNRVIRLRSDCFKSPYGGRDILFSNQGAHTLANPQGEWRFEIIAQGGVVDLEIISNVAYTGAANQQFQFCILTLDVEPIQTPINEI